MEPVGNYVKSFHNNNLFNYFFMKTGHGKNLEDDNEVHDPKQVMDPFEIGNPQPSVYY